MVVYKDHNGTTSFNDSITSFTYAQLVDAFGTRHDCKKLAKVLGIKVEKLGETKPQIFEVDYAPKKKKKKED